MHMKQITSRTFLIITIFSFAPTFAADSLITRDGKDNCTSKDAYVRVGSGLCQQELDYQATRLPKIKSSLEQALGMQLEDHEVPHIALCASGGGYRAMIAVLGSLAGMEYIKTPQTTRGWTDYLNPKTWYVSISQHVLGWMGYQQEYAVDSTLFGASPASLLDSCLYTAVLSGSTWTMAGWLQSRQHISDYIAHVTEQVAKPLYSDMSMQAIAKQLLKKESYNQDVSIVDIYGSMLAQKLLKNLGAQDANAIDLTDYRNVIEAGQMPMPISTAVIGKDVENYEWVEFTPYEVGSVFLNAFVPTWAFGRQFNNGKSVDFAPPQSLGFGMGIWGSAFSVDAEDIYQIMIEPKLDTLSSSYLAQQFGSVVGSASHLFQNIYDKISKRRATDIMGDELTEQRASPSQIHNWTYNLLNARLNNIQTLEFVDGGLSINLPFPPLLRPERKVNIIIVLDDSSGDLASELPKTEQYAKSHGLKFPRIDYSKVGNVISVHKDPTDVSVPVVIYIPLIANPGFQNGWNPRTASYTSTFNFQYSADQVAQLTGLTKFTMQQSQHVILDTIRNWVLAQRS